MKRYLRAGLAIVLLGGLLYFADLGKITTHLLKTDPMYYLAALAVFLTVYLWSSLRWDALITGLGYEMSLKESLKVIAMSYGFNKVLPFNSGDLTRSKIMERYTQVDSHGEVFGAVAVERLLDVVFVGGLTAVSGMVLLGKLGSTTWLAAAIAFIGGAMIFIRFADSYVLRIAEITPSILEPAANFVKEAVKGYSRISRYELLKALAWNTVRWSAGVLVLYLLGMSVGASITIVGAALATGVMNLVAALPITPAGIGPVEATGTGALMFAGLSSAEAATVVVLQRSLGLLLMATIGLAIYGTGQ